MAVLSLKLLGEFEVSEVPTGHVVRHPPREDLTEFFELGLQSYHWRHFDNDTLLRWWNGYDGVTVGAVFREDGNICGAVRLDRRDEESEGMDIIGNYSSIKEAQTAVLEAYCNRWHNLTESASLQLQFLPKSCREWAEAVLRSVGSERQNLELLRDIKKSELENCEEEIFVCEE